MGFGVVVVRHVPATICDQCGAEWLSDSVAAKLETVVAAARARKALESPVNQERAIRTYAGERIVEAVQSGVFQEKLTLP